MRKRKAVIVGAGPAGLTAAYELAKNNFKVDIFESNNYLGGISTTINYRGNRMDLGGHRFFSKSQKVINFWQYFLPVYSKNKKLLISYQGSSKNIKLKDIKNRRNVMLVRNRKSRIYYQGKLYDYPISLSINTIQNLGIIKLSKILLTYLYAKVFPKKPERNLEDFFINRFGRELYLTFFKSYTEKVWGKSCTQIDPSWGAQRVKGLSLHKAIFDKFLKTGETSLIQQFLYPQYGPGQMWETVAKESEKLGAKIFKKSEVTKVVHKNKKIISVEYLNKNKAKSANLDYLLSTMPIKHLINSLSPRAPKEIIKIANKLEYRDFYIVGILIKKTNKKFDDNWIYIHDPKVEVGRIQFFNNWSPYMVKDNKKVWLGMEYFASKGDHLWERSNKELIQKAKEELEILEIGNVKDILDATLIRVPKAYPSYTGSYHNFDKLKAYLMSFKNLYPIGRNGMHKYNNQDHSMLTAMYSVENIISGKYTKEDIWSINTEEDYHESSSR